MSPNEKHILNQVLITIGSINADYYGSPLYNFDCIGRLVLVKRMLAEIIDLDINDYLLPNESKFEGIDEYGYNNNREEWIKFIKPCLKDNLTDKEVKFLLETLLPTINKIPAVDDSDSACLRCAKRMVAEVAGYHDLKHYRLMYEDEVKPIYFKDYKASYYKNN